MQNPGIVDGMLLFLSIFPFVEGGLGDLEKKACQALCRLRNEGDDAKEVYSVG